MCTKEEEEERAGAAPLNRRNAISLQFTQQSSSCNYENQEQTNGTGAATRWEAGRGGGAAKSRGPGGREERRGEERGNDNKRGEGSKKRGEGARRETETETEGSALLLPAVGHPSLFAADFSGERGCVCVRVCASGAAQAPSPHRRLGMALMRRVAPPRRLCLGGETDSLSLRFVSAAEEGLYPAR